jgi:hypothetical protein
MLMTADTPKPLKGDEIQIYVPRGSAKDVKVVEVDPPAGGNDITLQVSRERKTRSTKAVGIIVK